MKDPFTPNNRIKDPSKFAGRDSHVRDSYEQVQSGKHIMIAGGKGVGKTSLCNQLKLLFCGDHQAAKRFAIDITKYPPRLTLYIASDSSPKEKLVPRIIKALEDATGISADKQKRSNKVQFGFQGFISSESTNEVVEYENPNEIDTLISSIKKIRSCHPPLAENGAVIVIDELDTSIEDDTKWGVWFKSLIESMQSENLDHITFVLIGTQWTHHTLLLQHSSLRRLLQPIFLPDMADREIAELCIRALSDTKIIFSSPLIYEIARLSNGHPYSAHLLGSALFKKAVDEGRIYNKEDIKRNEIILSEVSDDDSELAIKLTEQKVMNGPLDMLPIHLKEVITRLVETLYSTEYKQFSSLISDPIASKIIESAALCSSRQFSIVELKVLTRLPDKSLRKALAKLVKSETFKQYDLNVFEFSDPLLKLRIRLINESQNLKAEALYNSTIKVKPSKSVSQKSTTIPTEEELEIRKAELNEFIIEYYQKCRASDEPSQGSESNPT